MSKNDGEETYLVIFGALKHPIRRRILRMLRAEELTYTQILNNLNVDSGHLNYHLENLGELLVKTEQGKYRLSSIGEAATHLMTGVEENDAARRETGRNLLSARQRQTLLQVVILGAIAIAGVALLNVSHVSTYFFTSSGSLDDPYTRFIQPNSTLTNIDTINVREFPTDTLTTQYSVFFQISVVTNSDLLIQLAESSNFDGTLGPNFQQLPLLLFNETRDGPLNSGRGSRLAYTILVPLPSPKERAYLLDGIAWYFTNITNLGARTLTPDVSDNETAITQQNHTASINLQTSYPLIQQTDHPYFYHGVTLIVLASAVVIVLYLPKRARETEFNEKPVSKSAKA